MRTKSVSFRSRRDVHLWKINTQRLVPSLATFFTWLSDAERTRINRLLLPARKITAVCSRGILRWILACYLDQSPAAVKIEKLPGGKPLIPNTEFEFNLSHSGNYLFCAVGLETPLGIDIQQIYPISGLEKISRSHFQPRQVKRILNLKGQKQLESFFQHWVNLEAYLKAEGTGFRIQADSQGPEIHIALGNNSAHSRYHIRELRAPEGHKAALVTLGEKPEDILSRNILFP